MPADSTSLVKPGGVLKDFLIGDAAHFDAEVGQYGALIVGGPDEVVEKIRFYDDVAVVNGTENWKRKDGKSGRFIWTDVIVKRQNKWRVVSSQDLAVSAEK